MRCVRNNGIAYLNVGDIVDILVSVTRVGVDDVGVPNLKTCQSKIFQEKKNNKITCLKLFDFILESCC